MVTQFISGVARTGQNKPSGLGKVERLAKLEMIGKEGGRDSRIKGSVENVGNANKCHHSWSSASDISIGLKDLIRCDDTNMVK